MNHFLDCIGVEAGFRAVSALLGRVNLYCKGDAPSVKETQEEKAFAEIAGKKWQYYQDNFKPLEQAYMDDVNSLNTDGARDFASGVAGSTTSAAYGDAVTKASRSLADAGINPASGKYQSTMGAIARDQGSAVAENKAMAENSVDDQYVGGLQNISAIGRGQSTTAQAGMSDLASAAANKAAGDAYSSFNKRASTINAVGTAGGLAAYSYGNQSAFTKSQNAGASIDGYKSADFSDWVGGQ